MTTITFKVADEDAKRLKARARAAGTTLSEFVRRQISPPRPQSEITLVKCAVTGATIFAQATHLPPLNTKSVRAMLESDFP